MMQEKGIEYYLKNLVFNMKVKHHNICVVGDDDQGLYRFRGATIRNILEFPHKFENEGCKIIPLVVNYRSNSDIVDFYNEWISTTSGHKFKFSWDIYRYQKKIEPHVKSDIQSPAVVKLFSKDDEDEWHEKILGFIKELKESGKLTDYNQLAFLFSSVKHQRVTALANFLERNGINVYSPRSDMFFKRDEIKLALGCLMLMFPKYVMKLEKQEFDFLQVEHYRYYRECIVAANEYVTRADNKELLQFIRKHGKVHAGLTGTTDYAYSGLLGRKFIGADINLGAVQVTTKRLLQLQDKLAEPMQEIIKPDVIDLESGKEEQQIMNAEKYTGFEVYNVNNYDFFRNPIEARDLIIQALEIQPFPQSDVWDGELDGRMVKIMPVNRIATKADLEELKANLPYKTYEKRKAENPMQPVEKITIVCMGHEPDLKASLEQELSEYKLNIEIVDILRDKKDLQLKREAEAEIVKEGNKLVIRSFYPMNLMQKLSLQKEYVEDWRQLVESIMIDWNYDGVVMQPAVTDVPDKKKIVRGIYDIPEDAGTIRVKITDLLAESLEMEVE